MKLKSIFLGIIASVMFVIVSVPGFTYPVDGYEKTGIRRLERLRLILADSLRGTKPPEGGRQLLSSIKLNLQGSRGAKLDSLPEPDAELQKQIQALFPGRDASYSVAVLDITPGRPIRFAERQSHRTMSPGSVGKLCIAAGFFTELAALYPADTLRRIELLKSRKIPGGEWVSRESHEVPFYDIKTQKYQMRKARTDDVFNLYEWVDHMLSVSSNGSANVVWKEALLMRQFGKTYPPSPEAEAEFFSTTPKNQLAELAHAVVNEPLRKIGIGEEEWRLGSFFNGYGKRAVPVSGGSTGSSSAFVRFLMGVERGKLVDKWSSLEFKRLMYMTARRIRYASSPALEEAAVYYKSGSLYSCKEEAGYQCGKYRGNRINVLNSVAIVEQPDSTTYIVALMSNVLKKNSSVEHQSLATFIDRLLRKPVKVADKK